MNFLNPREAVKLMFSAGVLSDRVETDRSSRSKFENYTPKNDRMPLIRYISPEGHIRFIKASNKAEIKIYKQDGWREYDPSSEAPAHKRGER